MFSITDFGAVGDGKHLNTEAIQNAIDACHAKDGGAVRVPAGVYLSGSLLLKNGVTLHIEEEAVLLGSENLNDYYSIDSFVDAVGQDRGRCLVGAIDAKNIGITGSGTIDGQGGSIRSSSRPFLLRFVRCQGLELHDSTWKRSAAWTCHLFECSNVNVTDVTIDSRVNGNNDGIDIDSCKDVSISNCEISTGDDAICLKSTSPTPCSNIEVKNCKLSSNWGAVKIGTESMGDFTHIRIHDCLIRDTNGGGVKVLSADGANLSDVQITDLEMVNVDMPLFVRLGERCNTYRDATKRPVGSMRDLTIRNIKAETMENGRVMPATAIFITGTPGHAIEGLTIEDFQATIPGGGTLEDASRIVPEQEQIYPEYIKFDGHLPAYGAYIRHARDVRINGCRIDKRSPDLRHSLCCIDVHNAEIGDFKRQSDEGAASSVNTEDCTGMVFQGE